MSATMTIREPAAAIAAGRCLNARVYDRQRWLTTDHPTRCGWCDYPQPLLAGLIAEFHAWSGYSERHGTYAHHELRIWADRSSSDQREQVRAAQQLEDEPPPAPGLPPPVVAASSPAPGTTAAVPTEPDPAPAAAAPTARPRWAGGPS